MLKSNQLNELKCHDASLCLAPLSPMRLSARRLIVHGVAMSISVRCCKKPRLKAQVAGQISPDAFGRLWLGIAEAMNDEFFGNAARAMRPGSFTLMGPFC